MGYNMKRGNSGVKFKELGSSLDIQGKINSVEELDLCSYNLYEIIIIQNISNNELYITLHERFLGINFDISNKESNRNIDITRKKITYDNINISLTNNI